MERLLGLPRRALAEALADALPASAELGSEVPASIPAGGRRAAEEALARIDPLAYARSRNHVDGAVTGLSPWIRHGVLSIAEVRDAALARVTRSADAEKLIAELGWRDYWRRVHASLGARIMADVEPPALAPRRRDRLDAVPDDVLAAATGMRCIDAFVRRLHETGHLHNHERLWLASWLVHVRCVRWQTGADWFLRHLVDGDPASNHLSWQWVAGTFAAKPYVFDRGNLQHHTSDAHCAVCPLLGRCDVEGPQDELVSRLFLPESSARQPLRIPPAPPWRMSATDSVAHPLVWLTLDSAASTSPAAMAHPAAPTLFVIDPGWLAAERPTLKRLVFLFECLADVPGLKIDVGDPRTVVPAHASAAGCDGVAVADTPCPRVRAAAHAIARELPVAVHHAPPFCNPSRVDDVGRFSRYWNRVRSSAMRPSEA